MLRGGFARRPWPAAALVPALRCGCGSAGRTSTLLLKSLSIVLLVSALGCSAAREQARVKEEHIPVWPGPPERARIVWESEIRGPGDVGIEPSFASRVWNWISGRDTPRLLRPYGISVGPDNRLWISDPGAGVVHVFDRDNGRHQVLPDPDDESMQSPIGIAHDNDGITYVSDSVRAHIRRFDSSGKSLEPWDADGALQRPTGLAFEAKTQRLWVVDTMRHEVLALDSNGNIVVAFGGRGSEPGRFNYPTHVALDDKGRLYITDSLNFRVQIMSVRGEVLGSIGKLGDGPGHLSKPKGVAVDGDGHIYVVDAAFDNVQIFDEDGRVLLYFGQRGSARGEFWLPSGIFISGGERIYVGDSYNKRVQVFRYLGG